MTTSFERSIEMTRPTRTLAAMALFLATVGAAAAMLTYYSDVEKVVLANAFLSALIAVVFALGAAVTFRQVLSLGAAADWLEAYAEGRAGARDIAPPGVLAAAAALLRDRAEGRRLKADSASSVLDSVSSRLDESRDIARYTGSLLVFLGLLGTFWGLANTVPAVVETIKTLSPQDGGRIDFGRLMKGLEDQLGGMGAAFASSLLGLAGSLVIGFLELLAGHAQNRFYREFEDLVSSIVSLDSNQDSALNLERLGLMLEDNSLAMRDLTEMLVIAEDRRIATFERLEAAADLMSAITERLSQDTGAATRLLQANQALAAVIETATERNSGILGGMDAATRLHIRSIDAALLRMLEDTNAGRADTVQELRSEIRQLTRIIAEASGHPSARR